MSRPIPCDYCTWEGPWMEVGDHLDASPECAKLLLESCADEEG